MLIIRLQRVGRKNHAEFRVVLTEHTRGPKANYVEALGHYNPHTNEVTLNADRIKEWISKGAQVSDTMNNILVSEKIIKGEKINVLPKKTPIAKEEEAAAPEAVDEKKEQPAEKEEAVADETPAEEPKEEKPEEAKQEKEAAA